MLIWGSSWSTMNTSLLLCLPSDLSYSLQKQKFFPRMCPWFLAHHISIAVHKSSRNLLDMCKKTDHFSFLCLAIHHFRIRRKGVWCLVFFNSDHWSFTVKKAIIVNYAGFCYSCWYFQTLKVSLIGLGFLREDLNNLTAELQSQESSKVSSMSDR